jgi:hypothetical protein
MSTLSTPKTIDLPDTSYPRAQELAAATVAEHAPAPGFQTGAGTQNVDHIDELRTAAAVEYSPEEQAEQARNVQPTRDLAAYVATGPGMPRFSAPVPTIPSRVNEIGQPLSDQPMAGTPEAWTPPTVGK